MKKHANNSKVCTDYTLIKNFKYLIFQRFLLPLHLQNNKSGARMIESIVAQTFT